jgi:hypothetical protein
VSDGRLVIRSYRRVFRVDQRIYRVDRWALPVPGGVPLLGVVYFAATLLALLALSVLPVVGELVAQLNPPLRYVIVRRLTVARRIASPWTGCARGFADAGARRVARCRSRASRSRGMGTSPSSGMGRARSCAGRA